MKDLFIRLKDSLILFLVVVGFCATWPFLMIIAWIRAIYSHKISDSTKISITKEVLEVLGLFILLSIIYLLNN